MRLVNDQREMVNFGYVQKGFKKRNYLRVRVHHTGHGQQQNSESFFGCLLRSSQRLGIMIQECTERRRAHEKSGIFTMHYLLALLT